MGIWLPLNWCINVQIERQRGITVKAQTASMLHKDEDTGQLWLINLIDTPGNKGFALDELFVLSDCLR